MQESILHIVRILQSDKILNLCVNQALLDCSSAMDHHARNKQCKYLKYNCQFSRHSFDCDECLSQKVQNVGDAKEIPLRNGERSYVIRFECLKTFEAVSYISLKREGTSFL